MAWSSMYCMKNEAVGGIARARRVGIWTGSLTISLIDSQTAPPIICTKNTWTRLNA
jgi:hypothetical protein